MIQTLFKIITFPITVFYLYFTLGYNTELCSKKTKHAVVSENGETAKICGIQTVLSQTDFSVSTESNGFAGTGIGATNLDEPGLEEKMTDFSGLLVYLKFVFFPAFLQIYFTILVKSVTFLVGIFN